MHIYIIARGYPDAKEPQWGCFEKDQAEALAQYGHTVTMLSFDGRFRWRFRKIGFTFLQRNGVSSINYFACPSAIVRLLGEGAKDCWEYRQLRCVYKRAVQKYGKPDILYSHYLSYSYLAVQLHQEFHIPVVGIEHWSMLMQPTLPPRIKAIGHATYPSLNALIAVSSPLRDAIYRHFQIDSNIVGNVLGNEFCYTPIQKTDSIFRFVTTGSLIYRKGLDLLINALAIAKIDGLWELDIIGNGPEETSLKHLAEQLGLADKIHFLGRKTKEEIVQIYNRSDIYISASRSETFGVAILEALACGLPAISTICGGPEEFITEKNGLLIPIEDTNALANAIGKMISTYSAYDHRAIADDCQARFSPQVIAHQLTNIFQQVISSH